MTTPRPGALIPRLGLHALPVDGYSYLLSRKGDVYTIGLLLHTETPGYYRDVGMHGGALDACVIYLDGWISGAMSLRLAMKRAAGVPEDG